MPSRIEIVGETFGRWRVLEFMGGIKYRCECECGTVSIVASQNLRRGISQSCGCFKVDKLSKRSIAKIEGQRFGRLVVLGMEGKNQRGHSMWRCQCDCGKTPLFAATRLITGTAKSCGCFFLEQATTHGLSGTKTYDIWISLKQRCSNAKLKSWPNYGGRGIKVCDRWLSYENFLADMGEARPGYSIDRINVNGDYEPNNCRWATKEQQVNNTRRNKFVMLDGVEMPLTKAIKHLRETAYQKNAHTTDAGNARPCL